MSKDRLDAIVANVAARTGLTPNQIRYGSGRGVRDARHAVFYCASQRGMSDKEIADYLGLAHWTVTRGQRRVEVLLAALVSEGVQ